MSNAILRMEQISKRFPGVLALDNVSFQLEEGEIFSICGENGAGKSTLMKILSGHYPAGTYEGRIFIGGKEQHLKSMADSEKAGIAMIYQELNVEQDLSVGENVMLGYWPVKKGLVDWQELHQRALETLKILDIEIDTHLSMRALNASMQQLVCIARALVRNPRILILDEPSAALTEKETENLIKVLYGLKARGLSCIYISHKLEEIFEISDRIMVMRDGKRIGEYKKTEIVPERVINDMVGGMIREKELEEKKLSTDVVLKVENLMVPHPYAHGKNIIEQVSFELHKGEILGLAGLVGSGRSETLRAIFGAMPKASGKIFKNGKEVKIEKVQDAVDEGIFMISEDRKKDGFVGTMSIKENMTLASLKRVSDKLIINENAENKLIKNYYDYLKVKAASADINISVLSGGNQQKVIFAKALLTQADILFLDEPTRGIDIGAKSEIYKIIQEIARKGISIVVISSELPELIGLCDRFLVLCSGRIGGEFYKSEVTQQKILHAAAFGKMGGGDEK